MQPVFIHDLADPGAVALPEGPLVRLGGADEAAEAGAKEGERQRLAAAAGLAAARSAEDLAALAGVANGPDVVGRELKKGLVEDVERSFGRAWLGASAAEPARSERHVSVLPSPPRMVVLPAFDSSMLACARSTLGAYVSAILVARGSTLRAKRVARCASRASGDLVCIGVR
jgi:hypothetical protein